MQWKLKSKYGVVKKLKISAWYCVKGPVTADMIPSCEKTALKRDEANRLLFGKDDDFLIAHDDMLRLYPPKEEPKSEEDSEMKGLATIQEEPMEEPDWSDPNMKEDESDSETKDDPEHKALPVPMDDSPGEGRTAPASRPEPGEGSQDSKDPPEQPGSTTRFNTSTNP